MGTTFSRPFRLLRVLTARTVLLETFTVLSLSLACGLTFYSNYAKLGLGAITLGYMMMPLDARIFPPRSSKLRIYKKQAELSPEHELDICWSDAVKPLGGATNEQYLVVGGAGFLGRRIVHALILRGEIKVRVMDMDLVSLQAMQKEYGAKIEIFQADVTKRDQVDFAVKDCDCVYAPFACIRYWEWLRSDYEKSAVVNVFGAKVLTEACLATKVKRLVATSTGTVSMLWPGHMSKGIDESSPACDFSNSLQNYAASKAEGEKVYLKANGMNGLLAVGIIRPCTQIFGYRDKLRLDMTCKSANSPSSLPVVKADCVVDFVHVDHIVLAHLLLEHRLRNGSRDVAAGEAFCINGKEQVTEGYFWSMVESESKKHLGRQLHATPIPGRILGVICYFMTVFEMLFGPPERVFGQLAGRLTLATLLTGTYEGVLKNDSKARTLLGYKPHTTLRVAIRRTLQEYRFEKTIMDKIMDA